GEALHQVAILLFGEAELLDHFAVRHADRPFKVLGKIHLAEQGLELRLATQRSDWRVGVDEQDPGFSFVEGDAEELDRLLVIAECGVDFSSGVCERLSGLNFIKEWSKELGGFGWFAGLGVGVAEVGGAGVDVLRSGGHGAKQVYGAAAVVRFDVAFGEDFDGGLERVRCVDVRLERRMACWGSPANCLIIAMPTMATV